MCNIYEGITYLYFLSQVWPYEGKDKVDLLVPPQDGSGIQFSENILILLSYCRDWERKTNSRKNLRGSADSRKLENYKIWKDSKFPTAGK